MMEMMFGSGSPMWTALPSLSLGYQPLSIANRAIAPPPFSSPMLNSGIAGGLAGAPYAPNSSAALVGGDATGFVTASSLLTAVALRRGQPQGPSNDHEIEEFIYDTLDLFPGAADVEVRCENGRATLTGTVQHKHTKRDVGEIAWAIPAVQDVQNTVSITSRRRARAAGRDADVPATVSARKQG
jgi:BON domain